MGLKKKLQKQKRRISQKFEKAASKANAFLDDLASHTTSRSALDDGIPTTITAQQTQDDSSPSTFFSKLDSFAMKFQQKLENDENNNNKYEYQVENTKDEATGETTTKLVTRDKETGEIVSSHTHVHLSDGSIRVTNIGESTLFAGLFTTSKQKIVMPPSEIPTDGSQIEYTFRELKDGEPTIFECEVKDGPEAGKKMEYKITTDKEGKSEYHLVTLRDPGGFKRHSINFVLYCMFWFTMAILEKNADFLKSCTMNSICMPIAPFSQLSAADDMDVRFEAPWWVPSITSGSSSSSRKLEVFSTICSGTNSHQTAIEWKSQNSKGQLSVYILSNTTGKSTRKERHSGLARANFFPSEIEMTYPSGQNKFVKQVHWGSS